MLIILRYHNRTLNTETGSIRRINDQKRCTIGHSLITATNELHLERQPAFVENNEFGKIEKFRSLISSEIGERDAYPVGKIQAE